MPTYQQLQDDVAGWANRRDLGDRIPGWVAMVEAEMAQTLRARCMVKSAIQPVDAAYINLPPDFATMESIRDATSGEMLNLVDQWSGHWTDPQSNAWVSGAFVSTAAPSTAYRLVHDCIEFLPHPFIPDPPDPNWRPQQIQMGWYARPTPLLLPADTNAVLENLYGIYLFGVLKRAAMYERDDDDVAKWDAEWQAEVTRANLHKQQSDYSGAPFRSELVSLG